MNSIDTLLRNLKVANGKAFLPFLPAGDPDLGFTASALRSLASAGASIIEVGVPFSDPVADGPVIQAAYTRALANGFKLADLFETVRGVASSPGWMTPLVAMASYSLIYKRGPVKFLDDASAAGFNGVVLPDLPLEEADEFARAAVDRDFKTILLVSPTTSPTRAERIVKLCSGFVYVVSIVGITGARADLPDDLATILARLRSMTDLPLCVGFGVSTPEQVKAVAAVADGVIVGSALVRCLEKPEPLKELTALAKQLAAALAS